MSNGLGLSNYHNHTREGLDLVIESWGGEFIQLYYRPDEVSIMLLLHEIEPLIEALKEDKAAQELPDLQHKDKQRLSEWNRAAPSPWDNDPTAGEPTR